MSLTQRASEIAEAHGPKAAWIALAVAVIGFFDNRCSEHAREKLLRENRVNRAVNYYMAGTNAMQEIEKQTK